jgi:hypothetical protein
MFNIDFMMYLIISSLLLGDWKVKVGPDGGPNGHAFAFLFWTFGKKPSTSDVINY